MWAETLGWTAVVLSLAAIAGLFVRGRVGVCRTFVLYLAVIAVGDILMLSWPGSFFQQWFWFGKELVVNILRFGLALELAYWTFRVFPTARATVRGVLLAVLMLTLGIVLAGTGGLELQEGAPALGPLISRIQPRIVNGALWLLTGIAGLVLWYRLPVHPFHKAILVGLVPYLLVYTVSLNLIETQGWHLRTQVNYVVPAVYVLVNVYWTFAAWRRGDEPVEAPPLLTDPSPGESAG
jgi:hypothetical protein